MKRRASKDLAGKRFGRLFVLKDSGIRTKQNINWLCRCDCGNLYLVNTRDLNRKNTQSCGCLHLDSVTKHGDAKGSKSSLYHTWRCMKNRCYNSKVKAYRWYGSKGIEICKDWHDYSAFKSWALANGYKKGFTIDRINHKGNYKPQNCQFLTRSENMKKSYADRKGVIT